MKRSIEDQKEVIKALAFGYGIDQIAEITGFSVSDINKIVDENADAIAEVKERYDDQ